MPSGKTDFFSFGQTSITSALESFDAEKGLLNRHNELTSRRTEDEQPGSSLAIKAGAAIGEEPRLPQVDRPKGGERLVESRTNLSLAPSTEAERSPVSAPRGVAHAERPKDMQDDNPILKSPGSSHSSLPSTPLSDSQFPLKLPAAKPIVQTALDKPMVKPSEIQRPAKADVPVDNRLIPTPPAETAYFENRISAGPQEMVARAAASFTAGTLTPVAREPKPGVESRQGTTLIPESPVTTQVLPAITSPPGANKIATAQRSLRPDEARPTASAAAAEAPQRGLPIAPKIAFPVLLAADHRDVHEPRTDAPPPSTVMQSPATKAEKPAIRVERQEPTRAPSGPLFETLKEAGTLKLTLSRPMLLRMKAGVYRVVVVDQNICDVVRITGRDLSITGRAAGQTHVTFFFEGSDVSEVTYLVEVQAEAAK